MKQGAKLGLLVVLIPVIAAGVLLLGYTAWHYDWRPDAMNWAETIRERIKPTLFNKEGVEIVSCKYVDCSALKEAQKTYPTLQIVDCVFNHNDALGNRQLGNKHHFYILDGKIIWFAGLTFAEATGTDPDQAARILGTVERHKTPENFDAQRQAKAGKGPPSMDMMKAAKMGGLKSKDGKSADGKAKEKDSTPDKSRQEKSSSDKTKEANDRRSDAMDRAEMIRERLKPMLFNKEGLEIVSCTYVKSSALDEARKAYPALQIVDCVLNHKDALGKD
jgi:hypothetical protein